MGCVSPPKERKKKPLLGAAIWKQFPQMEARQGQGHRAHHWGDALLRYLETPESFAEEIIYSDDEAIIVRDKYPKSRRHFLTIPRLRIDGNVTCSKRSLILQVTVLTPECFRPDTVRSRSRECSETYDRNLDCQCGQRLPRRYLPFGISRFAEVYGLN